MLVLSFLSPPKLVHASLSFLLFRYFGDPHLQSNLILPDLLLQLLAELFSLLSETASQGGISTGLFPFPSLKGLGKGNSEHNLLSLHFSAL